jgi:hypothetical protein
MRNFAFVAETMLDATWPPITCPNQDSRKLRHELNCSFSLDRAPDQTGLLKFRRTLAVPREIETKGAKATRNKMLGEISNALTVGGTGAISESTLPFGDAAGT